MLKLHDENAAFAAEKANPKLDLWFGGTGDPHLQAAEEGLTEAYKSPRMAELPSPMPIQPLPPNCGEYFRTLANSITEQLGSGISLEDLGGHVALAGDEGSTNRDLG